MPLFKLFTKSLIIAIIACFLSQEIWAATTKTSIKKIEFTADNNLEIALSQKSTFKIFTLTNPRRLVIDIVGAESDDNDFKPNLPAFVSDFHSKKNGPALRLVFGLKKKISIDKIRFVPTNNNAGKIIAELNDSTKTNAVTTENKSTPAPTPTPTVPATTGDFISEKVAEFEVHTRQIQNPDGTKTFIVSKTPKKSGGINAGKTPVIVIDAGHGGKDPGTIGNYARSKEKHITLSFAKELAKQLNNSGRYQAFLTRDDDIFIPLKKRVEIARHKKADMFISLHANAISDRAVSGFSIYTLSEKSSDKQAELLAQKENRVDIISGVNFSGTSQDIMKTLIDLSQRDTMNSSATFANIAIKAVRNSSINILQNTHRFAGFAVLTAPDMVSTLIELGYLSNKDEEELMNSIIYKRRVSESLVNAIDEYFSKHKAN